MTWLQSEPIIELLGKIEEADKSLTFEDREVIRKTSRGICPLDLPEKVRKYTQMLSTAVPGTSVLQV